MREQDPNDAASPELPSAVTYAPRPARPRTNFLVLCVVGIPVLAFFVQLAMTLSARSGGMPPRAICASNLRAIGQGLKVYASDYADLYPPTLRTLTVDGTVDAQVLVSPYSGHAAPACDYYYFAGLTDSDPGTWIVVYGNPAYTKDAGVNVLHVDGHVNFVKEPQFSQDLARFKADYEKARGTPPVIIPPH